MAFVPIQYLIAQTTAQISPSATAFPTDSSTTALLLSFLGNAAGNYTTVAFSDGINYEIMFLTGVTGGAVTITRGREGTTATTLAKGATFRFIWTETSILAIAPGGTVTCNGAGATNVSGGPNYTISSDFVIVTGGEGINVSGSYPNFNVSSTVPSGPPGPPGPDGPVVVVTASGIATASGGPDTYDVAVAAPAFVAGSGISITGSWPNITITNTQTPGGTGTVTSVSAGAGITITGTPTINPTIALSTVGPGAGTYGGITLNAYGQVTAFSSTLITSFSTTTTGVTIANPSQGIWTINIANASPSTRGLTAYAPATSGGSNDSGNNTQAVTPAGVNAVVNALVITPASLNISGTQNALSSGSYTNTIAGLPIVVAVLAGKFAFIDIYVEMYDSAAITVPQNFGVALFNSSTLLVGVSNLIPSSVRRLQYLVTGPLSATLTVKTTTLTGTQTLGSYSASIVGN